MGFRERVTGRIIPVTPYAYGSGTTVFDGTAIQTVKNPNSFGAVTIAGTGLNLDGNMTAGSWLLKSGVVATNGFKAVATSTTTTAIQPDPANPGYSANYIVGTFSRYIAPSLVDSYDFPVAGNGSGQVNLRHLDQPYGESPHGHAVARWMYILGPSLAPMQGWWSRKGWKPYTSVNGAGVWHITPDAEPTGGQYDLLLYLNGFTGLADNEFALLERPDLSSNAADWVVPSGSSLPAEGTAGRPVSSGVHPAQWPFRHSASLVSV